MATFVEWLKTSQHTDPGVQKLADKARTEGWGDSLSREDVLRLINANQALADDEKAQLTKSFLAQLEEFQKEKSTWRHTVLSFLGNNAQMFVIFILAFAILGSLGLVIVSEEFRKSLADIEISRGIITFFFGLGTVGVALILVTAAFTSDREKEDIKERFDMGKQVLTALIGIFGTIVGFYFGTEVAERSASPDGTQVEAASSATPTEPTEAPAEPTGEPINPTETQGESEEPSEPPE